MVFPVSPENKKESGNDIQKQNVVVANDFHLMHPWRGNDMVQPVDYSEVDDKRSIEDAWEKIQRNGLTIDGAGFYDGLL